MEWFVVGARHYLTDATPSPPRRNTTQHRTYIQGGDKLDGTLVLGLMVEWVVLGLHLIEGLILLFQAVLQQFPFATQLIQERETFPLQLGLSLVLLGDRAGMDGLLLLLAEPLAHGRILTGDGLVVLGDALLVHDLLAVHHRFTGRGSTTTDPMQLLFLLLLLCCWSDQGDVIVEVSLMFLLLADLHFFHLLLEVSTEVVALLLVLLLVAGVQLSHVDGIVQERAAGDA